MAGIDINPYRSKLSNILGMVHRFPTGPSKVLDHLFIGSEDDATNLRKLKELGITHVLNCAAGYTSTGQPFYGRVCKYHEYEAEDDPDYNMLQHFSDAYDFIESARSSGGKVLVHCLMGINRSGLITVGYVMMHQNVGPLTAAQQVKKARSILLTNDGFQEQLIKLAQEKGMLEKDKEMVAKM